MPLAVAVLDKTKVAGNQLEKAANKCGQAQGQLETPALQAQVGRPYSSIAVTLEVWIG